VVRNVFVYRKLSSYYSFYSCGTSDLRVGSKGARHSICLLQLHWLPVRWRIQFKLCCIMHSVFNGNCPAYLSYIVQTVSASRLL